MSFDFTFAESLKPELFEGFRLDYTKRMNHKFSLIHRYIEFWFLKKRSIFVCPK